MMLLVESLGQMIKSARVSRHLSQAAAGKLIGIDQSNFGRWERGEIQPSFPYWAKIQEVLGIPVEVLEKFRVERGSVEALQDRVAELTDRMAGLERILDRILAAVEHPEQPEGQ